MGMITTRLANSLRRTRHIWSWRLRYWWMDTRAGAQAQVILCCVSALVAVLDIIHVVTTPPPPGPHEAVIWWVVYIIVALIAAAVSYATRQKSQTPAQNTPTGQTTEDGQSVIRFWGTHWIDDQFLLAWKIIGRDPIKSSGGK
jgi:hypothetical protein